MSYRRSDIELAQRCMMAYGLKDYALPIDAMLFGELDHACLYKYGKHCIEIDRKTDISVLREIMAANAHRCPASMMSEWNMLSDIHTSDPVLIFTHRSNTHLEKMLTVDKAENPVEPDSDRAFCHATLDRLAIIGDEARITDYKTNRYIWDQTSVENNFQARFYSWLVLQYFPKITSVKFTFAFTRYRALRSVEFVRLDLDDLFEKVILPVTDQMEKADKKGLYSRRISEHCMDCRVLDRCGIFKNAPPTDFDEMGNEALVEWWLRAKAFYQSAAKELKKRVEAGQPIQYNGKVLDFHPQEVIQYPYDAVKDALLQNRIPRKAIAGSISFSNTKLQALLKAHGMRDLGKMFEENYSTSKIKTEFGLK